jgi:hypothetical protein
MIVASSARPLSISRNCAMICAFVSALDEMVRTSRLSVKADTSVTVPSTFALATLVDCLAFGSINTWTRDWITNSLKATGVRCFDASIASL